MSLAGTKGVSVIAPSEQHTDNAWQTPPWVVDCIHELLHGIELDPCTSAANNCCAERFYTAADDGILQPWNARSIYVNPPYGRTIAHWVDKCALAGAQGAQVVALVPARVGSAWFRRCCETAQELMFFDGRLNFWKNGEELKGAAAHPSALFAWNVSLSPMRDLGFVILLTKEGGVAA